MRLISLLMSPMLFRLVPLRLMCLRLVKGFMISRLMLKIQRSSRFRERISESGVLLALSMFLSVRYFKDQEVEFLVSLLLQTSTLVWLRMCCSRSQLPSRGLSMTHKTLRSLSESTNSRSSDSVSSWLSTRERHTHPGGIFRSATVVSSMESNSEERGWVEGQVGVACSSSLPSRYLVMLSTFSNRAGLFCRASLNSGYLKLTMWSTRNTFSSFLMDLVACTSKVSLSSLSMILKKSPASQVSPFSFWKSCSMRETGNFEASSWMPWKVQKSLRSPVKLSTTLVSPFNNSIALKKCYQTLSSCGQAGVGQQQSMERSGIGRAFRYSFELTVHQLHIQIAHPCSLMLQWSRGDKSSSFKQKIDVNQHEKEFPINKALSMVSTCFLKETLDFQEKKSTISLGLWLDDSPKPGGHIHLDLSSILNPLNHKSTVLKEYDSPFLKCPIKNVSLRYSLKVTYLQEMTDDTKPEPFNRQESTSVATSVDNPNSQPSSFKFMDFSDVVEDIRSVQSLRSNKRSDSGWSDRKKPAFEAGSEYEVYSRSRQKVYKLEVENEGLRMSVEEHSRRIKELLEEVFLLRSEGQQRNQRETRENTPARMSELQQRIHLLERELNDSNKHFEEMINTNIQLQVEIRGLRCNNEEVASARVAELKRHVQRLESGLKQSEEMCEELRREGKERNLGVAILKEKLRMLEEGIESKLQEINRMEQHILNVNQKVASLLATQSSLQTRILQLDDNSLSSLHQQNNSLQIQLSECILQSRSSSRMNEVLLQQLSALKQETETKDSVETNKWLEKTERLESQLARKEIRIGRMEGENKKLEEENIRLNIKVMKELNQIQKRQHNHRSPTLSPDAPT